MRGSLRIGSERGQSTALVASLLFVLILFVAVVVDVGQAVNRRIALQVVADTGAYTGASAMAVGYNQLAIWNRAMQYAWLLFTNPPSYNPMYDAFVIHETSCDAADFEERLYYSAMGVLQTIYNMENIGYAFVASGEAETVSDYNAEDLFPGESLEYSESDLPQILAGHSFAQIAESVEVDDGSDLKAIPFLKSIPFANVFVLGARKHNTYACEDIYPPRFEIRDRTYPVWYRKLDIVDSFVWEATAPATHALMFDQFFGGPRIIPVMKAIAVAKALGGSIEEGRNEYVAKMMPVSTVMTLNRVLDALLPGFLQRWTPDLVGWLKDDNYDRGVRLVTH